MPPRLLASTLHMSTLNAHSGFYYGSRLESSDIQIFTIVNGLEW